MELHRPIRFQFALEPDASTTNVSGTIVAGNGTVTITLNNNLTNAQLSALFKTSAAFTLCERLQWRRGYLASSNSTRRPT